MINRGYRIRTQWMERDGKRIYGHWYLPKEAEDGPVPTVLLCHGFGVNRKDTEPHARAFAKNGIAAYSFDFIGGGHGILSDGEMTEMSVLTEAKDLLAVYETACKQPWVDTENLFLFGNSQGGFIATYCAAELGKKVRGLIAQFPAYVLQADARARTPNPEQAPEVLYVHGSPIGRIYSIDATSFDIYEKMPAYPNPVLILHGTADPVVPYACSERAVQLFPNAKLIAVPNAGHGFTGKDRAESERIAVAFVREHLKKD